MADRVRTHTRKNPDGSTTRVTQHARKSRPRKALVSPGHSWKLLKKAMAHGRKKRRGLALLFGGLAVGEFAAWSALSAGGALLVTAGALAIAFGTTFGMAAGWRA